jgi:hypothetical protein
MTAKLRKLEADKARVEVELVAEAEPPRIIPNVETIIRDKIKALEDISRDARTDDALTERARTAVQSIIGQVRVVEDDDGVVAKVDLGRCYITHGAEERVATLQARRGGVRGTWGLSERASDS